MVRAASACCDFVGNGWNGPSLISMRPAGCAAYTSVATRTLTVVVDVKVRETTFATGCYGNRPYFFMTSSIRSTGSA